MTNPRLVKVDDLFQQLVELPPHARAAQLDRECGDDPELRRAVEALLAHDGAAGDAFLAPKCAADGPDGGRAVRGTEIGPYRLIERLGSGGCGVVYAAQGSGPKSTTVALKIIKLGTETENVVSRFETERQTLALMKHPNIACMYDAGSTPCGRPYVVMEYADGPPLTHYGDAETLSIEERLRLFLAVCDAIGHAHQRGVVHRDIKPTNILVTIVDGRPVPKVIDFGVAMALRGSLATPRLVTDCGELVGTPEYMSPEQAAVGGEPLDSTTDIYALGVVLYQLVAGVLPIDAERYRSANVDDIRRTICDSDVPAPSTRLRQLAADAGRARGAELLTGIAVRRRTNPGRLLTQLAGGLDRIIMQAMDKDRHRRHASARELAADLLAHLESEESAVRFP